MQLPFTELGKTLERKIGSLKLPTNKYHLNRILNKYTLICSQFLLPQRDKLYFHPSLFLVPLIQFLSKFCEATVMPQPIHFASSSSSSPSPVNFVELQAWWPLQNHDSINQNCKNAQKWRERERNTQRQKYREKCFCLVFPLWFAAQLDYSVFHLFQNECTGLFRSTHRCDFKKVKIVIAIVWLRFCHFLCPQLK